MRILFDSKLSQFKTPFGVLIPGEVCTLHIQIPVSCRTEHVELLLLQEDGTPAREVSLSRQETGALYECFGAAFSLERAGLYFYCFRVTTKNEQFRLYKQGNDTNMEAGDFWQLSCVEDAYPVPEALRGAVMYQIFPDRFRRVSLPDELLDRYPTHISGGEQQRVAIARGLTMDRRLLLADEPTGNLDSENSDNIIDLLLKLAHEENRCVIVVTHDLTVMDRADVVYRISDGLLQRRQKEK